uniref:Odorant receptor n=1 Tax=Stomoxys calcitrans TaxID=35570 RepID=A0A1I8NYJ1_STOCA
MVVKLSLHRFEVIIRIVRLCSSVCGADVLDPKYRINLLTFIVSSFINLFLVFTGYTIYVNLYVERDWTKVLQTLCMVGSALQGYCKLLNAIWNRHHLKFMAQELHQIYKEYEQKHAHYRQELTKNVNNVLKCIKFVLYTYAINLTAIVMVVPIYRLIYKERIFVMQFLLSAVNPDTEFGYMTMNCMHLICIMFGAFGNFAADTFFITFVGHIPLLKDVLRCKFEDLNVKLDEKDMEKTKEYKAILRDIFEWHQKYMT